MRAPQERTMRDLYDRTRHKDLAAPEVRRAASTAAPTACALAVVGFSPIGRDGTRWGLLSIGLGAFWVSGFGVLQPCMRVRAHGIRASFR